MRQMAMLTVMLVAGALLASPAAAKTHSATACQRIDQSLASGKPVNEVAKALKVSAATVNRCAAAKSARDRQAASKATSETGTSGTK